MTPLILLVGFLGAGKTTYLRKLLPELRARGLDPHVIINDYQNAAVDAELLRGLVESVLPISGSCVCCGSRDELLGALESFDHASGRVLVVETNGTTDSEELIELLSLEPELGRFTLPVQVSMIDGKRWQKRFWHNGLELEQARTANYLFVSRLDEIDRQRAEHIGESFKKHGFAGRHTAAEELAEELAALAAEVGPLASRDIATHPHDCSCGHHHDHEEHDSHDHEHGAHHFASLQIELPETVTRLSLERFLASLPKEVLRVKGLARLAESPEEYHVFQKVDGMEAAQLLPIGRESRVGRPLAVCIGPNISEESVRARVEDLFAAQPAQG